MKKLIVIVGPNGTGKTTTCECLLPLLGRAAQVDGDWCRAVYPPELTEETLRLNEENVFCMIRNALRCPGIDSVVFSYGYHGHRKALLERVIERLCADGLEFQVKTVLVTCSEEENVRRMIRDGRDEERIRRAVQKHRVVYEDLDLPTVDSTHLTPEQTAQAVFDISL